MTGCRGEASGKTAVIGAISWKGNVLAKMILNTSRETLGRFHPPDVSPNVSLLATDEHPAYGKLGKLYAHGVIQYREGVYVRGNFHTNNIEILLEFAQSRRHGVFPQRQQKVPAPVSERVYFPVQQPRES